MHCVAGMVLAGEPERTASRSLSAAQSHRLEDGCSITDSVSAGHARDPEPSRLWSSLVWRPALGHEACSRKRSHVYVLFRAVGTTGEFSFANTPHIDMHCFSFYPKVLDGYKLSTSRSALTIYTDGRATFQAMIAHTKRALHEDCKVCKRSEASAASGAYNGW